MADPLVAFKAGRLQRRGDTNWVDAQPTKGRLQLLMADDGLLHFQWVDRITSTVKEVRDLIIFPNDASFEKVSQSSSGRTYVLKFTSSNQRYFYWFQDVSTAQDNQIVNNVNGLLQDASYIPEWEAPSNSESQPQASTSTVPILQQQQRPSAEQLAQIRSILLGMGSDSTAISGSAASQPSELSLADILTPTNLAPVFASPDLVQAIFPHLPSDLPVPPSSETLQRIIESPQFHSAVRSLDQALGTGLLGGLVRGLGLPEEAGTGAGAFLNAIKDQAEREGRNKNEGGGGDDTMETD
ncbi:hypothetical protein Clacol_007585 [Clathrus columnatus]|uniref:Adhesion regulating molecule n=1 Tax=Clathrus columnatus TaxID=1419009 RepID=A0AAV5AKW9_9AGAM|nr:hypothetical protein Clacol_007585 [Clathrus columnatus]